MRRKDRETAKAVAAAGVGGAGGATAGVLELAAQGVLTGLSAGVAIGAGAAAGALAGYALLRLLKKYRRPAMAPAGRKGKVDRSLPK